jgi:hypothetical protein
VANRTIRTPEKGEKFLKKLRETGGNVSRACKAEGIGRRTAYEWRAADEAFARAWDEAVEAGLDDLEQEAYRRAFKGTRKPVYQKGACVGYIREYSDTLTIFLLKGGRPEKFRERFDVELKDARARAEAAVVEMMRRASVSRPEAIELLKPHIPQISDLVH